MFKSSGPSSSVSIIVYSRYSRRPSTMATTQPNDLKSPSTICQADSTYFRSPRSKSSSIAVAISVACMNHCKSVGSESSKSRIRQALRKERKANRTEDDGRYLGGPISTHKTTTHSGAKSHQEIV